MDQVFYLVRFQKRGASFFLSLYTKYAEKSINVGIYIRECWKFLRTNRKRKTYLLEERNLKKSEKQCATSVKLQNTYMEQHMYI